MSELEKHDGLINIDDGTLRITGNGFDITFPLRSISFSPGDAVIDFSNGVGRLRMNPLLEPLEEPLTPRETEVLGLLAKGKNRKEIAEALVISTHTARNHVAKLYSKLGVHDDLNAVVRATRGGLIDPFRD
jgi:DNA-binding CsgD family transcriptional regulator